MNARRASALALVLAVISLPACSDLVDDSSSTTTTQIRFSTCAIRMPDGSCLTASDASDAKDVVDFMHDLADEYHERHVSADRVNASASDLENAMERARWRPTPALADALDHAGQVATAEKAERVLSRICAWLPNRFGC